MRALLVDVGEGVAVLLKKGALSGKDVLAEVHDFTNFLRAQHAVQYAETPVTENATDLTNKLAHSLAAQRKVALLY